MFILLLLGAFVLYIYFGERNTTWLVMMTLASVISVIVVTVIHLFLASFATAFLGPWGAVLVAACYAVYLVMLWRNFQ